MKTERQMVLSVITVCRNDLGGLKKTYESVVAQTFGDFEWIVADGASTDGTVDYLRQLEFGRLVWSSEPDGGVYDAMNKALAKAKGRRVLFLNSGDRFAAPDVLERLLSAPSTADVVYGDVNLVWPDRTVLFPGLENPTVDRLLGTSLPHPASAILRETLCAYGGYDPKYRIVSDWKFWMELAQHGGTFEHRPVLVADFAKDGISTVETDLCTLEREQVRHELLGTVKLSVVVPVYNVELYLRECLDSVLAQPVDLEVICVDDNSSDSSAAICEEYANRHPNVTLVRNRTNQFAGPCRNAGIDLAKGEYIAFMDSDDRAEKGIYRKLVDVADKEHLEVVRGSARIFDATTGEFIDDPYWRQDRFRGPAKEGDVVDYKDVIEDLIGVACVPFTGICRRDLLIRNRIRYNALRCSNDISFFIEMMLKATRVRFVPDSVVQYRVNNRKSLVGVRTKYYGDVLSCGHDIISRIRDYDAEIRRQVLDYVFNAYPHWLDTAVSQSGPERQEEIKKAYRGFFMELDKRPWGGRLHDKRWVGELEERLGPEPFVDPEPFLVSVVIPVCNAAQYVGSCLDSLAEAAAAIGSDRVEVICIDDGSQDGSLKVLRDYAEANGLRFGRMTVIQQENRGLGASRNRGLRCATGRYVYYLDADDLVRPEIFSAVIPKMRKNDLEILIFSAEPFADQPGLEDRISGYRRYYSICEAALDKVVDGVRLVELTRAKGGIHVSAPLRVYDRLFLLKHKLFFPEGMLHEDFAIGYVALLSAQKVMAVADRFYLRRVSMGSITGNPVNTERRAAGHMRNAEILTDYFAAHPGRADVNLVPLCELASVILSNPDDVPYGRFFKCIVQQVRKSREAGRKALEDRGSRVLPAGRDAAGAAMLESEVAALHSSEAYRVGMFVTWPARRVYRMFRCWRENGLKYTLRRLILGKGRGRE